MKSFKITNTIHGDVWHQIIDPAAARIDRALKGDRPAGAVSKAALAWSAASTALDAIPAVLEALPDQIVQAQVNGDLTPEAKRRDVDTAVDATKRRVTELGDTVRTKLARVDELLRTAATPPRPGDTAADEAKIAGAKSDARMILDAEPADLIALSRCLADLLRRALGDSDKHAAWVLAGSRWPVDYMRTRDRTLAADQVGTLLGEVLDEVLDAAAGSTLGDVRRIYRSVVGPDGTWAVEAAVGTLPNLLEDVRAWTMREMATAPGGRF